MLNKITEFSFATVSIIIIELGYSMPTVLEVEDFVVRALQISIGFVTLYHLLTKKKNEKSN